MIMGRRVVQNFFLENENDLDLLLLPRSAFTNNSPQTPSLHGVRRPRLMDAILRREYGEDAVPEGVGMEDLHREPGMVREEAEALERRRRAPAISSGRGSSSSFRAVLRRRRGNAEAAPTDTEEGGAVWSEVTVSSSEKRSCSAAPSDSPEPSRRTSPGTDESEARALGFLDRDPWPVERADQELLSTAMPHDDRPSSMNADSRVDHDTTTAANDVKNDDRDEEDPFALGPDEELYHGVRITKRDRLDFPMQFTQVATPKSAAGDALVLSESFASTKALLPEEGSPAERWWSRSSYGRTSFALRNNVYLLEGGQWTRKALPPPTKRRMPGYKRTVARRGKAFKKVASQIAMSMVA